MRVLSLFRVRMLAVAWLLLFLAGMVIARYAPLWVKVPGLMAFSPLVDIVSHWVLFGRRAARRRWLLYRFIVGNFGSVDAIANRKLRKH